MTTKEEPPLQSTIQSTVRQPLINLGSSDFNLTKCFGRFVTAISCPEFAVYFQHTQFIFGHGFKDVVIRGYTMENENP